MRTRETPPLGLLIAACLVLVNQAPMAGYTRGGQSVALELADATETAPAAASVPGCIPAWVIDARGIRRLPDRCPGTAPAPAGAAAIPALSSVAPAATPRAVAPPRRRTPAAAAQGRAAAPNCEPPWFIDAKGTRRLRAKCL